MRQGTPSRPAEVRNFTELLTKRILIHGLFLDALTRARLDWRAACVADLNHCIANLNGFRAEAVTNLTTLAVTKSACVIGAPVQAPQLESIYVTTFNGLTAAVNSIPVQTDPVV